MARKKQIEDDELIRLIDRFLREDCKGNVKLLKKPAIATFVSANGYPGYAVTTLRRNPVACAYIDSLLEASKKKTVACISGYNTLDVEDFLDNNRTRQSLKASLTKLDAYYHSVADASFEIHKEAEKQEIKIFELSEELAEEKERNAKLWASHQSLAAEVKSLRAQNQAYKTYIQDYTCPDIASKLLAIDKMILPVDNSIDDNLLEKRIIHTDTLIKKDPKQEMKQPVKAESTVISSLYERLEEESDE